MKRYSFLIISLWSIISISAYAQMTEEEAIKAKDDSIQANHLLFNTETEEETIFSPLSIEPYVIGGVEIPPQVIGPDNPTIINIGTKSNTFSYNHTQDTKLTGNAYKGTSSKDIYYKFTLSTPMNIELIHASTEVIYTNAYLVQWPPDNYKLYTSSTYPLNLTGSPTPGKACFKYDNLPAGTYHIICEGYNSNGKITTTIKGTLPEPKIINISRKGSPFTYTHTQNTNETPNAYVGRPANDVYYKIQTVGTPMDFTISHCGSEVSDTYIHLLDKDFNRIAYNDDYSGEGKCSNTRHAFLKMEQLEPGIYYVVSEGYTSNGNITTTIKAELPPPVVIKAGTKTNNFSYTHTQDTRNTVNAYMGNASNDIFYELTITRNMDLEISMCGSEVTEASGLMYPGPSYFMEDETEERYCTNSTCPGRDHIYRKYPNISAGTYTVVSEGKTNGKVKTNIKGTVVKPITFDVGSKSSNFTYNHTHNTLKTANAYGKQPHDVFYKFTLQQPMEITINTGYSSRIYLLNSNQELIEMKESSTSTDGIAKITRNLQAGTYYAVSEKTAENGTITTAITGTVQPFIIDVGFYSQDFHYTHTQDTRNTVNAYRGQAGNDVYYKIRLVAEMDLIISHCGSEVADTYLHLLDASFNRITYNDTYSGIGACSNTQQAYLKKEKLAAGIYYIVSEGKIQNGNITTTIEGYFTKRPVSLPEPPSTKNYIQVLTPLVKTTSESDLNSENSLQSISYLDGIGRPSISIQANITPARQHLTTLVQYDGFGREYKTWLPTAQYSINADEDFLAGISPLEYNDQNPYTLTEFENSPLSRVTAVIGPGEVWHRQTKGVSQAHMSNTSSGELSASRFSISSSGTITQHGTYPTGELYVEKVTDEDGNVMYTFTNQLDELILQRQIDGTNTHDTYYVYDEFGRLRYVLPPAINGTITSTNLSHYAYVYTYDERGRCIEKKLPGIEPVYYVYDKADRLILMQDGNMRTSNHWLLTCYDPLGRVAYTLRITLTDTPAQLRTYWASRILTEKFNKQTRSSLSENPGYPNSWNPSAPKMMLTVYYYDNYDFLEFLSTRDQQTLSYTAKSGYDTQYKNAKGLLTGTRIFEVSNGMEYTISTHYYDLQGNEIQNTSLRSSEGAFEKNYYKLTFTGTPELHLKENTTWNKDKVTELYSYRYDHANRLKKVMHQLNGGRYVSLTENSYNGLGQLISKKLHGEKQTIEYKYNIRSWITEIQSKDFIQRLSYNRHFNGNISSYTWGSTAETFLRRYDFTYDGLNRLKKARYSEDKNGLIWSAGYYDVEIGAYDKNGNITQMTRKGMHRYANHGRYPIPQTNLDDYMGVIDDLKLTYIGNQLRKVVDTAPYDPVYNGAMQFVEGANVSTEYTYDSNGNMTQDMNAEISYISYNILNLPTQINFSKEYGHKIYNEYEGNGNKKRTIYFTDSRNISLVPTIAQANGEEEDKSFPQTDITSVGSPLTENSLFPKEVAIEIIDYHNNLIYKNEVLDKILISGGYIDRDSNGKFVYHYYLRDHQGNNRVVIREDGFVEQVNHYYPFGGLFGASINRTTDQPYKYGDKELNRMFGYDTYDFHARSQMPMLGRFTSMDPHAENYYSISPYAYCANNPIRFIDPNGKDIYEVDEDGELVKITPDTSQDIFYIVDKDGNRTYTTDENGNEIENSISFEYGTVGKVTVEETSIKNKEGKSTTVTMFEIKGDEKATQLFEFMAKPTSTKVEWTHAKIGIKKEQKNIVGNSHSETSTAIGTHLRNNGYTLREVNHNHPNGYPQPSSADKIGATSYHLKNPNTKLHIYLHPDKYIQYDRIGIVRY